MLSIKTWKSSNDALKYYKHEQPQYEYYTSKDEEEGILMGADVFGLIDGTNASETTIKNLLEGCSPEGQKLVQGARENHRPGYDLTFSAPKSVSILWAFADEKIKEKVHLAHKKSVNEAMKHMEKYGGKARRGKGGKRVEAVRNLIFSKFEHSTSRENDPQLHTHCLLFNLAQRQDGSFGAIESKYIYDEKMATGAIYRAELAKHLELELGCKIIKKGITFEIAGISDDLIREFSTRREQIEEDLKKKGFSSAKSADYSALGTRKVKKNFRFWN